MVKRKNYLLNPISRQNFANAFAVNHNLKLEVCRTQITNKYSRAMCYKTLRLWDLKASKSQGLNSSLDFQNYVPLAQLVHNLRPSSGPVYQLTWILKLWNILNLQTLISHHFKHNFFFPYWRLSTSFSDYESNSSMKVDIMNNDFISNVGGLYSNKNSSSLVHFVEQLWWCEVKMLLLWQLWQVPTYCEGTRVLEQISFSYLSVKDSSCSSQKLNQTA